MKKVLASLLSVVMIVTTVFLTNPIAAHAQGICPEPSAANNYGVVVSRDDGVWLFPLGNTGSKTYSQTDWAGCDAGRYSGRCDFHNGTYVPCYDPSTGAEPHNRGGLGHSGIDIGNCGGENVYPAADGEVAAIIRNVDGRGNTVIIEHKIDNNYSYYSYYQHLAQIKVSVGAKVYAKYTSENVIGTVGNTGGIGAYHLHFAILRDTSGRRGTGWSHATNDIFYHESVAPNGRWLKVASDAVGQVLTNPRTEPSYLSSSLGGCTGARKHRGSISFTTNSSDVSIKVTSSSTGQTTYDLTGKYNLAVSNFNGANMKYASMPTRVALQSGMSGDDIWWLRNALAIALVEKYGKKTTNSEVASTINSLIPTNMCAQNFDSTTLKAVKLYQAAFNLEVDGAYGPISKKTMINFLVSKGYIDSPWNYSGTPTRTIYYGIVGNDVKWVQVGLNILNNAGLDVDGSCGPAGRNAILNYQRSRGLSADGYFGPGSRSRMLQELADRGY